MKVLEDVSGGLYSLHIILQSSWALTAYLEQQVRPHWNVHRGPAGHPFQSICGQRRPNVKTTSVWQRSCPSPAKGESPVNGACGYRRQFQVGAVGSTGRAAPGTPRNPREALSARRCIVLKCIEKYMPFKKEKQVWE